MQIAKLEYEILHYNYYISLNSHTILQLQWAFFFLVGLISEIRP